MAAPQVEHVVALFRRGQEVVLDTPEQLSIVIVNLLCKAPELDKTYGAEQGPMRTIE